MVRNVAELIEKLVDCGNVEGDKVTIPVKGALMHSTGKRSYDISRYAYRIDSSGDIWVCIVQNENVEERDGETRIMGGQSAPLRPGGRAYSEYKSEMEKIGAW